MEELIDIEYKKVKQHTIQLFVYNSKVKPLGTGVFVKLKDDYFILSASHVLKDISNENLLYIKTNSKQILSLQGDITSNRIESKDHLDAAFFKLTDQASIELLKYHKPLESKQIIINYYPIENEILITAGFPEAATSISSEGIDSRGIIMELKHSKPNSYSHHNVTSSRCILTDYRIKDLNTNKYIKLEDPHGYSGSGLWTIKLTQVDEKLIPKLYLIGILYQYSKSKYYVLFAERMEFITREITRKYDIDFTIINMALKQ